MNIKSTNSYKKPKEYTELYCFINWDEYAADEAHFAKTYYQWGWFYV